MWVNLWTYDNYCHDCIWPIWSDAITFTCLFSVISGLIYFFRTQEGKTTSIEVPSKLRRVNFFNKHPIVEFKTLYLFFLAAVLLIVLIKSAYQLINDSFPDDYIRLQSQIKGEGQHCTSGIVVGYRGPSNQTVSYSRILFENGKEFRYQSSDTNSFCYSNARINSGIARLIGENISLNANRDKDVDKIELRLCWTRNVNMNLPDEWSYDGLCIYQIDARLVSGLNRASR